jgi:peptidoglycan/LPS O-acetylase OafA/YrhL
MPELDFIRGVAILGVVVYHAFYVEMGSDAYPHWQRLFLNATWAGRLGVNLFFVLSGFLITGILLDSKQRPDYYKRFYVRRSLRILPAYLLLLGILALLRFPSLFLVLSLLYLSNLTPLFGIAIAYPILWSLAVEEHFYFVWPMVVRKVSTRALLWISAGIIVISPILRLISFHYAQGFTFNEYTWNSADGLACGAVLAILVRERNNDRKYLFRLVCAALLLAAALSPFAVTPRAEAAGAALQVVPWHFLFFAVVGACLLIGTTSWRWFVHWPLLRFYGRISYGLYLIHSLVFIGYDRLWHSFGFWGLTKRYCIVLTVATLLAWLSRTYFEGRFLQMKRG